MGQVLCATHLAWMHLTLTTSLRSEYHHEPCGIEEETEAQRSQARIHTQQADS